MDAGRCFLGKRVLFVENGHGVGGFQNGIARIAERDSHHRAAVKHLANVLRNAAGECQNVIDRRSDRNDQIFRMENGRAVYRDAFFHKRHARAEITAKEGQRGYVENETAHVCGKLALRNLASRSIINEDFFAALRIGGGHQLLLRK